MQTGLSGDRAANGAITFREATDPDYDFLRRLYHATREEEMKHFPFDETQKIIFLNEQFAAQYQHYRVHYPTCERNIIELDGQPIGRMWIDEWKDQIRLVDIALMPGYRAGGIGTKLLKDLLARGAKAGKPVTIHVESFNPALRLYERLGFEQVDTNGVYLLMRWTPPATT
jgi:GNAT superfamily N-acetyltransferase